MHWRPRSDRTATTECRRSLRFTLFVSRLGVTNGLGYAINDARDTLSYERLAALVLLIGYLEGAEVFRRLREARFIAIVTPSVKHITAALARSHAA